MLLYVYNTTLLLYRLYDLSQSPSSSSSVIKSIFYLRIAEKEISKTLQQKVDCTCKYDYSDIGSAIQ